MTLTSLAAASDAAVTAPLMPRPTIDGQISAGEWDTAAVVTLDHQLQPGDNVPPSVATRVYVARDTERIYFAFVAQDDDPTAIRGRVVRRDEIGGDDYVTIHLDTYDDRRRAYVFSFNPLGIQSDGQYIEGVSTGRDFDRNIDRTWDGQLESKGAITADGYIVEAAIPFSTLRFAPGADRSWGLHVQRWVSRKGENISWRPISRSVSSLLTQMGALTGLTVRAEGPRFEIIPTLVSSRTDSYSATARDRSDDLDPGLTATWTLTPNMAASATVNPDYSQIEADVPQIDVNQRFPLRYAERRPFFYEGGQVFRSPGAMNFLETRQIVDPSWGTKLAGKSGRNTIGFLAAADAAPGFRASDTAGAGDDALAMVGRYQRDLLQNSTVGGFVTNYSFAGATNSLVAADGQWRLSKNTIGFQFGRSWSSTEAGDVTGHGSYVWYDFVGRHWRVFVNDQRTSDDYDSKLAFIRRRGFRAQSTTLGYEFQSASNSWWVRWRPFVVARRLETSGGLVDESYVDPGVDIRLARDVTIYAYYSFHKDAFLGREYPYQFYANSFTVNAFKRVTFDGRVQVGEGINFDPLRPMRGRAFDASLTVTVRPRAALDVQTLVLRSQLRAPGDADPSLAMPGEMLFRQTIFRNKTNYQFTRFHAARMIAEFNTFSRVLSWSALYAWTPRPATSIYAGIGDVLDEDPFSDDRDRRRYFRRTRRSIFVKLSYGWMR